MTLTHKKIVDEKGNPTDAVIPWEVFVDFVERHGLGLDEQAQEDLLQAKKDLEEGNEDAFVTHEEAFK